VYSVETLRQLSTSLFSSRYSEPVSNFLLPAIAKDPRFPFVRLLHSLVPSWVVDSVTSVTGDSPDWCLAVEPSIWMLHSTLTLAMPHTGLFVQQTLCKLKLADIHGDTTVHINPLTM